MRIVISGYHGFDNLGDEAILTVLVQGLKDLASKQGEQKMEFTVLSGNPQKTRNQLPVDAVSRKSPLAVFRALKGADGLISGGGTLFQDSTSRLSPWYYLSIIWLALLLKKPVYVFGQGIGPIRTGLTRWALVKTFQRAQCVILRDPASLEELRSWGYKGPAAVYPDPAFLLFQPASEAVVRNAVALNLRPWPGIERVLPIIARVCDRLIEELRCNIVFIPLQGESDLRMGRRLQVEMEQPITLWDTPPSSEQIVPYYGRMRLALGMRLHHLIFASCAGRPWVGLAYDPKVQALAVQMGKESMVLAWEDLTPDRLWALLMEAWQAGHRMQPDWIERVDNLRRKSGEGLRQLYETLRRCGAADGVKEKMGKQVGGDLSAQAGMETARILGVKVDKLDLRQAVEWIKTRIDCHTGAFVITANAELVVKATDDAEVAEIIEAADLVVPDGMGLLWAGSVQGTDFPGRVPGVELMEALVQRSVAEGWRVAFYGAEPGIAAKAAEELGKRYHGFRPVACYHGFLSKEEEQNMLRELRELAPDIVFVALGAPRQERWILANKNQLPHTIFMGVGGSFDVFAGKVRRAPRWMCDWGLEWLFRLIQEPRRFRRMLALPRFVMLVLREKWLARG